MPYANDNDLEDPLKNNDDDNISKKQLLKIPNQIVVLSDVNYGFIILLLSIIYNQLYKYLLTLYFCITTTTIIIIIIIIIRNVSILDMYLLDLY